jgi:hypothetical protein
MIELDEMKKQASGKQVTETKLSDRIAQFINLAAKASANPYYTQSEKIHLKGIGEGLGLPHRVIEEVIQSNAVNNANLLKEISVAKGDLKTMKAMYAFTIQTLQSAKENETYSQSTKNRGTAKIDSHHQNQQAQVSSSVVQYQTSIAGLQNHMDSLKVTTGGEGGDYRVKQKGSEVYKHTKIATDKTTLPLVALNKNFNYEK